MSWGQNCLDKRELFPCDCGTSDHQFIFEIYDWDSKDELPEDNVSCSMSVFIQDRPFWTRLWYAIKMIFGYKTRYGHWDYIMLNYETTGKLIEGLERYRDLVKKYRRQREASQFDSEDY